eukprot:1186468-Prorocentrum_minimum.AAC.1
MQGRGVQRHEHLVRVQQLPQGGAQVVALEGVVARQVHHVCLQLSHVCKGVMLDPPMPGREPATCAVQAQGCDEHTVLLNQHNTGRHRAAQPRS